MEAQADKSHVNTPVPPYEAWPSVPTGPLNPVQPIDRLSAMEIDSPTADRQSRATSIFSMDDIEVARALTGLREASPAPSAFTVTSKMSNEPRSPTQPEPLLSLLTSQHPLVATAINGSLSAYTSSKSYSPRFRYGAEFVERNIASPVVNTVGTTARISGVETGVRWWLKRNDSNDSASGNKTQTENSNKRRRIDGRDEMQTERGSNDVALPHRSRATSEISQETLPAYDDHRSPLYEELAMAQVEQNQQSEQNPAAARWQTRLMMTTSGLGVAMNNESLRSLKYCLSWLRWANTHLSRVLASLQSVLEEWDRSQQQSGVHSAHAIEGGPVQPAPRDQAAITNHLQALKTECIKTLQNALDIVSKYTGGALPENARLLVRRHLTSLPQRFKIAFTTAPQAKSNSDKAAENGDAERQAPPEAVTGAQRVIVLAKEGLDMMAQVSGVVNGTIVSAEEWCDRLGKKRTDDSQANRLEQLAISEKQPMTPPTGQDYPSDAKMAGQYEKSG